MFLPNTPTHTPVTFDTGTFPIIAVTSLVIRTPWFLILFDYFINFVIKIFCFFFLPSAVEFTVLLSTVHENILLWYIGLLFYPFLSDIFCHLLSKNCYHSVWKMAETLAKEQMQMFDMFGILSNLIKNLALHVQLRLYYWMYVCNCLLYTSRCV